MYGTRNHTLTMRKLLILCLVFALAVPPVMGEMEDKEKQQILLESYEAAYWQAEIDNSMGIRPKKSCGWIAHRTWEIGQEKGIDVDAVWVCKMDRYHSHIIPGVMLSNGTLYCYQPSHSPFDYYSKNYFGKQEIIDTWDFKIVNSATGSSWPINLEYKEGTSKIYVKSINISEN